MRVFTLHFYDDGSESKEANDRNAEQKMTFVDDTKKFRDCSMSVLHDSIWE